MFEVSSSREAKGNFNIANNDLQVFFFVVLLHGASDVLLYCARNSPFCVDLQVEAMVSCAIFWRLFPGVSARLTEALHE